MAGESQQTPSSEPDPSVLTTEQVQRAVHAERDYVDGRIALVLERLRGIDRATELLSETVNRTPTDIEKEIKHLRELADEKFKSVQKQFDERDIRSERESLANTVKVDAAFAAQKDSAAKIEGNTKESVVKIEGNLGTQIRALADKIEDVKGAVSENRQAINSINDRQAGGREQVTEHRGSVNYSTGLIGFGIAALLALLGLMAYRGDPAPAEPVIIGVPAAAEP